jgi:cytochrome o ubiquinol oxidase operon protein cyoD
MATRPKVIVSAHEPGHSIGAYITGFALSMYLTIFAYLVVTHHLWSNHLLLWIIAGLAVIQFFVQSIFFLHLGSETRPRWNLLVFGCMIVVVLILVFGSVWIMNNLDYHHMAPAELKTYLRTNEGL